MKKMKKMLAIVLGTLLALIPVMSISIVSFAKEEINGVINWHDDDTGEFFATTSCVLSVAEESEAYYCYGGRWEADENSYRYYIGALDVWDFYEPGDTVTFYLPFAIDESKVIDYAANEDYWSFELVSPTCVVATNMFEDDCPWINVCLPKPASSTEDQFWFKPMKTQLNIAAEIASTSGKEAVAEVSGDFGLSYEIMKWLEDHPNVTLKYALTYKGADYNIEIKGGQKLADPEIPWYGPEYLIGKFAK